MTTKTYIQIVNSILILSDLFYWCSVWVGTAPQWLLPWIQIILWLLWLLMLPQKEQRRFLGMFNKFVDKKKLEDPSDQQMSHLFWWSFAISSGGIDLVGPPIKPPGFLLVPRIFILKDQFWWADSPQKNNNKRFTLLFPIEGKTSKALTFQKSNIATEHEPFQGVFQMKMLDFSFLLLMAHKAGYSNFQKDL